MPVIGSPLGNRSPLLIGFQPALPDYSMFYQDANSRAGMALSAWSAAAKRATDHTDGLVPKDFKFEGLANDYFEDEVALRGAMGKAKGILAAAPNKMAAMRSPEFSQATSEILDLTMQSKNKLRKEHEDFYTKHGELVNDKELMAGSDAYIGGDEVSATFTDGRRYSVPTALDPSGLNVMTNASFQYGRSNLPSENLTGRGSTLTGNVPVVSFKSAQAELEKEIDTTKFDSWATDRSSGLEELRSGDPTAPITSVAAAISRVQSGESNERQIMDAISYARNNMSDSRLQAMWSGWTQSPEFKDMAKRDILKGGFISDEGGKRVLDTQRAFEAMFEPRFKVDDIQTDFIGKTIYGIGKKFVSRKSDLSRSQWIMKPEDFTGSGKLGLGQYVDLMMQGRVGMENKEVGVPRIDRTTGQVSNFKDENASVGYMPQNLVKELDFGLGLKTREGDVTSTPIQSVNAYMGDRPLFLPDGSSINTPNNPARGALIIGTTGKIIVGPRLGPDGFLLADPNDPNTKEEDKRSGYYEVEILLPNHTGADDDIQVFMPKEISDLQENNLLDSFALPGRGPVRFVPESRSGEYHKAKLVDMGGRPMEGAPLERTTIGDIAIFDDDEMKRYNKAWSYDNDPVIQRDQVVTMTENGVKTAVKGTVVKARIPIDEKFLQATGPDIQTLIQKGWISSPNVTSNYGYSIEAVEGASQPIDPFEEEQQQQQP